MKDLCEKMFLRHYADALGVNEFIESQVAYQDNIAYNVRQLIGKPSLFHYGPDDIHVSLSFNILSKTALMLNIGEES
jgi:hypothetical protein